MTEITQLQDQESLSLFNPLTTDFSYTWFDEHDAGHLLTLPSGQITILPKAQGRFMLKHLIDYIDIIRGGNNSYDIRRANIENEILK